LANYVIQSTDPSVPAILAANLGTANTFTLGSLSGTSGTLESTAAGAVTFAIGDNVGVGSGTTYGGVIQNGASVVSLEKTGSGTLTLTGVNTYTGGTTINAGVLVITNSASLGTSGLSIGPATLAVAADFAQTQNINLTDPLSTIRVVSAQSYTNSGTISGAGGLTLVGGGTLTLGGTNSYMGGTTVNEGTLIVANSQAIADGTNLSLGDAALLAEMHAAAIPAPVVASAAVSPVPEPGTLALLVSILGGAVIYRRAYRRK
jgi:autotransporter-associated beta strand protein